MESRYPRRALCRMGNEARKVNISAPIVQYDDQKETDRDDIRVINITAGLKENAGDDDLVIVLGEAA